MGFAEEGQGDGRKVLQHPARAGRLSGSTAGEIPLGYAWKRVSGKGDKTMRIAMLTTWNVTDGASLHAELLGRELSKTSELTVFAPTFESLTKDRHLLPLGSDDDFVIRAFQQTWGAPGWVDERLREQEFDVLVVEALDRMPIPTLLEMFPKIKAKKVQVIHEWALPEGPGYYELGFDAIVCFDRRYKNYASRKIPRTKNTYNTLSMPSVRQGR